MRKAALKCFTTRCHDNPNYTLTVSWYLAGWGGDKDSILHHYQPLALKMNRVKGRGRGTFSCIVYSKIKNKNCGENVER